jgi:lipoprotein-anchoring transpeptidase ErfK/SrfK
MRLLSLRSIVSAAAGAFMGAALLAAPASANVDVRVDVSSQTMTVTVDGWHYASWRVSTAREGYHTPRGRFRASHTERIHYSRKYDNSPMPYSVFFKGGYAIHGTGAVRRLGTPASHGCVRLHPSNAAELYNLVREHGARNTKITITN